jgi:DNA-directed RNA polymerase specialized sigma subunit
MRLQIPQGDHMTDADIIRAAILVCDERQKYVIHRHYSNGVSFRQIAKDLEVDHSTILRAHDRAIARIRRFHEHGEAA